MQRAMDFEVTVRYIDDLDKQGLRPYSAFEWIRGEPDGSTKEIDQTDVVIAEGTYMYLSVARGKPTIGINQHLPYRANKMSDVYCPRNWDKYGHLIRYPINYKPGRLGDLISKATSGEESEWRERCIGRSMDPQEFAGKVEAIWRESSTK